jgi:hypothetical protein
MEHLDGNQALETRQSLHAGYVHSSHTAGRQLGQNLVAIELGPGGQYCCIHGLGLLFR